MNLDWKMDEKLRNLLTSNDPELRELGEKLFLDTCSEKEKMVLESIKSQLVRALSMLITLNERKDKPNIRNDSI